MAQDAITSVPQDAAVDSLAATTPAGDAPFSTFSDIFSLAFASSLGVVLLRILFIVLGAFLVGKLIDRVLRRWVRRYDDVPALDPRRQRALTLANLLGSTSRYVIWPLAVIMILSEMRIDVAALIATAGIAGLAVGFGAQTLVKDVISGVFLLFDNTIAIGDRVRIGTDYGTVEHIGVRLIKVRKFDGELMMVPAGELRVFGNTSIDFSRAIVEIGVAYKEDIAQVSEILEQVARGWMADNADVLKEEDPNVLAIMGFADSAILARVAVTVVPGEQFRAEREMRVALKKAFDDAGIEIPFPQRTVHVTNVAD